MGKEDPEYYPFRWKVADAFEDLFVLHRRKLIGAVLLIFGGLALGLFLFDGDNDVETTEPTATSTGNDTTSSTDEDTSKTSSTTTTTSAPSTTEATSSSSTTTTAPASTRPTPTAEQIAETQPGYIIEMLPDGIRLVGGVPTDDTANDAIRIAETVFRGAEVLDSQIVDTSFPTPEELVFRISSGDLFDYNRFVINDNYLPVIDQLATRIIEAEIWSVAVIGHTDSSGEADDNQRLSERRAQAGAERLIAQGVPAELVSVVGAGETQPIASNDTEEGQQANRRIEFVVTQG
jgi:outer membrane protein OmpA-like peptidoglycan-associated protein